jgi:hypothetical protein
MLAKVREMDSGLIADKVWTQTGEIKPETTTIRSVNLTMPDQYNYVVEIIIWNNDTIIKSGEDYIQLSPNKKVEKSTTETRKIQTSDFISNPPTVNDQRAESDKEITGIPGSVGSSPGSKTPGFGLPLSIILLCSAVILRRRFK